MAGRLALGSGLSVLLVGGALVPAAASPVPGVSPAAATSDSPRAPGAPTELFVEDFENEPTGSARLVTDYVGSTGTRYAADPVWVDPARCNGLIVDHSSTGSSCGSMPAVRALASALGTIGGHDDPNANHAVSAYTDGGAPGADLVQLETVQPFPLQVANRFVTFSVDTVAMSCHASDDPLLAFSLLDGSTETPVSDRPINPCVDPGMTELTVDGHRMRGGRVVSSGAVLFSGTEMGVRLRNLQGGGTGNDAAFDNVRVVDVTPRADLSLPASAVHGDVIDLIVDVTNTSEAGAKPGWSFAQTLPTGLTVAPTDGATSTCATSDLVATPGAGEFSVSADFDEGDVRCQIVVPVLVGEAGSHVVAASQSALSGLLPATDQTLVADTEAATISTSLTARLDDVAVAGTAGVADVGDRLSWVQTVVNVGNAPVRDLASTRPDMACEVTDLAVGARTSCSSPTSTIDQDAVDAGDLSATVRAEAVSRLGAALSTSEARAVVPVTDPAGSIGIVGEVTVSDADGTDRSEQEARPGDLVDARYTLTNEGTVTLTDVALRVDDGLPPVPTVRTAGGPAAEARVDCDDDHLAPGDSTECVVGTRTIVEEDLGSSSFWFSATATGLRPDGATVTAMRASDPIGLIKPAPALTATTVITSGGSRVGDLSLGDDWRGRVRVVNTGNVELFSLRALGFTCDVDRLTLGRATHCTSPTRTVAAADVAAGRVSVSATARAVDRWGTRVEATSSARAGVPAESVAGAPSTPRTPVAKVLAFTGSPLAVTVVGLGLLLALAGAWLVAASRHGSRDEQAG